MAITAIPSLHLKAVAYKTSKLYAKLPEGTAGNFTFARNDINASRTNKEGLVEFVGANICRFNYPLINGVVQSCPEILLEPTRENLVLRSQEFENASWEKGKVNTGLLPVVTANFATAPDGTTTADKIVFDVSVASNDRSFIRQNIGASANRILTCWVKSANTTNYTIAFHIGTAVGNFTAGQTWERHEFLDTSGVQVLVGFEQINNGVLSNNAEILVWGFDTDRKSVV